MHFDKDSKEYRGNGHYYINNEDWMSLWTYKKKNNIEPNTNSVNGDEGKALIANGVSIHSSKPDFGNFDKIYLYRIEDLKKNYK